MSVSTRPWRSSQTLTAAKLKELEVEATVAAAAPHKLDDKNRPITSGKDTGARPATMLEGGSSCANEAPGTSDVPTCRPRPRLGYVSRYVKGLVGLVRTWSDAALLTQKVHSFIRISIPQVSMNAF